MATLLTLKGFRKSYGARQLFNIDELQVEAGRAYVLTGQNGTGKTTLLRILAGLEKGEADRLTFMDRDLQFHPYPALMRAHLVYVHQHPVMFSTTLTNNIGYGLAARGVPRREIDRKVEEAIEWAGVGYLRKAPMDTLSGGEKQRIALARAKVLQPRLLVLDEPTASLDGTAREQVIALIESLATSGASVIAATHDRDVIHASHIRRWKLREGRLLSDSPIGKMTPDAPDATALRA